jgi:hypothetical protein
MDQTVTTIIGGAVPTLAVMLAIVRNELAISGSNTRFGSLENGISSLENRLDARMETLDRDLRDWAEITMQHNTDVGRLKDNTALD